MTSEAMTRAAPDYDGIVRTMQLYVEGYNEDDVVKLKRAFHDEARAFWVDHKGILRVRRVHEVAPEWHAGGRTVAGRIMAAQQAGDVAGVLFAWGDTMVEYHALLRIDGTWRITNKTAYHNRQPAVEPDCAEIVRVVQLYVDACNRRDGGPVEGPDPVRVEMFKEAFHADAWILYTDAEGTLHKNLISESFEDWAKPKKGTVTGRIISVVQGRNTAAVLLGFDSSRGRDSSWVDVHSVMRIDGIWKITNKTATHSSRAGGA